MKDYEETKCSIEFACIGCNRVTEALAWGQCGLIAFAAGHSVVIYKPTLKDSAGKISRILNGHKSRVNCVNWLTDGDKETEEKLELLSGSSDNTIILWERLNGIWCSKQILSGHSQMVCSLSSATLTPGHSLLVSAAADFSMKLWERRDDGFQCKQTVSFGNGFAHTVAMSFLPNSNDLIVACGCDDTTIRLYKLHDDQLEFVLALKGHKDSIRSLAFTKTASGEELLLASASQDFYIRLWKIGPLKIQDVDDDMLVLKEQSFTASKKEYSVVLESVLISHEGWVLGVAWSYENKPWPSLLSASMDRTMILWEYDEENKVWIDSARMGEVGGNTLGYYGCAYAPGGGEIVAHGYQGAFQMWKRDTEEVGNKWNPEITISGHFGDIEDFDWDPEGEFAITASTDQSTRLFAQWKRDDGEDTWHEIARPQVHGYDMKSIVMLDRYKYASGAQEKVIRVFSAPQSFHHTFSSISKVQADGKCGDLPLGATVPVLGLSNKAVFKDDIQSWNAPTEATNPKKSPFVDEPALFNPTLIEKPPVEDVLLQNTLWPEVQKLYGHGFEIFSLAATRDGTVLASTCKASKQEYTDIIIWDTSTWKVVDQLNAHTLTVTQLKFSESGKYLLSVSRDRTWALHQRADENHLKYTLVQKTDKTDCVHSRIIWACDWMTEKYFVTVSRDKKALVWSCGEGDKWAVSNEPLIVGEPATAVSASKQAVGDKFFIAVGLESGGVNVYTWCAASGSGWCLLLDVDRNLCPVLQVKRLRWREQTMESSGEENVKRFQLGVCSSDHSFRILKFNPNLFC